MKTTTSKKLELQQFAFTNWGGKRHGAGRKPKGEQAGVSHAKRPQLKRRFPVLVTQRLRHGLPSLRSTAELRVIEAALVASTREEFHVVEFSVQTNHLHLIVEAEDELALSRWLKGLFVRLARRLNQLWRRCGNVFPDR